MRTQPINPSRLPETQINKAILYKTRITATIDTCSRFFSGVSSSTDLVISNSIE